MRRLVTKTVRRLLNAGGYSIINTSLLDVLRAELADGRERLAETKSGVSQLQSQLGETLSHVIALRNELADAHERFASQVIALQRELAKSKEDGLDYQLLMAQQSLMAEFKDLEPDFLELYNRCKTFTMTSVERLYSLYKSVEYIADAGIPGDFVECGVWRGGSCMLMALGLLRRRDTERHILMYDTYAGHPRPDAQKDIDIWGNRAVEEWQRRAAEGTVGEWGLASLADVQANLISTGYPSARLVFIEGLVEYTVPEIKSEKLALLRLDTDWYESTRIALHYLYPRLVEGGVLIIDDYGHYKGQRQAVDEYFIEIGAKPLFHRVDYSCRTIVKRSISQ